MSNVCHAVRKVSKHDWGKKDTTLGNGSQPKAASGFTQAVEAGTFASVPTLQST